MAVKVSAGYYKILSYVTIAFIGQQTLVKTV